MTVQVMIKRKWKVDKPDELLPLIEQLRSLAAEQRGYLSGETLRSLENPEYFLVVSRWQTAEDWSRWLQSKARRELQGKVDSMIGERTFYEVFENIG